MYAMHFKCTSVVLKKALRCFSYIFVTRLMLKSVQLVPDFYSQVVIIRRVGSIFEINSVVS